MTSPAVRRRVYRTERDGAPGPGEGGARGARRPDEAPSRRRVDLPSYSDRFARLIGAGEAGDQHPERPPGSLVAGEEPLPGRIASGRCVRDRGAGAGADRAADDDLAARRRSGRPAPGSPVSRCLGYRGGGGSSAPAGGRGRPAVEVVAFFRGQDDRPARMTATMRGSARGRSRERPGVRERVFSLRRVGDGPASGA